MFPRQQEEKFHVREIVFRKEIGWVPALYPPGVHQDIIRPPRTGIIIPGLGTDRHNDVSIGLTIGIRVYEKKTSRFPLTL